MIAAHCDPVKWIREEIENNREQHNTRHKRKRAEEYIVFIARLTQT